MTFRNDTEMNRNISYITPDYQDDNLYDLIHYLKPAGYKW